MHITAIRYRSLPSVGQIIKPISLGWPTHYHTARRSIRAMASFTVALSVLFAIATGIPEYRKRMPNPDAQISNGLECAQLGHVGCVAGARYVNEFGSDFAAANYTWTKEFCEKDSDGDGVSNGAELGDPCCEFVVGGSPARSDDLSLPGDSDSKPKDPKNRVCSTKSTASAADPPSESRLEKSTTETNATVQVATFTPTPSSNVVEAPSVSPSSGSVSKSAPTPSSAETKQSSTPAGSTAADKVSPTAPASEESETVSISKSTTTTSKSNVPGSEGESKNTSEVVPKTTPESATSPDSTSASASVRPIVSEEEPSLVSEGSTPSTPTPSQSDFGLIPLAQEQSTPPAPSPACFSADSLVTLEDGREVRMEDVSVGDRVMVASGRYSQVFMFTHALSDVQQEFVVLHSSSGSRIALTAGHYIYASGRLVRAADVREGDSVRLGNGSVSRIVRITVSRKRGLFNPQTVQGDIVVNGVVASTYTESISYNVAHAMLAPLRTLYSFTGVYTEMLDNGVETYLS